MTWEAASPGDRLPPMKRCPHCTARTLPVWAALRSGKRHPVRCTGCGEDSFLPPIAVFPVAVPWELFIITVLGLAGWLSGGALFYASLGAAVTLAGVWAVAWPMKEVPQRDGDKVQFLRPSPLRPGARRAESP